MNRSRDKWTLLLYLAGEQSLGDSMILSLKELYGVHALSRLSAVVQFQPRDRLPLRFRITSGENGSHEARSSSHQRLLCNTDGRIARLGEMVPAKRPPVMAPSEIGPPLNTTNTTRAILEDFIVSGITENESDHYLVVLSGHASGIVGKRIDQDGFSPGAIRSLDLGPMFESVKARTGRCVDVLGIDACFMAMCEVCWELRSSVRFLVASEGLAPTAGWPYHRLLGAFEGNHGLSPAELACALVTKYLRYNSDFVLSGRSVDLAACRLDMSEQLAAAVTHLCRVISNRMRTPAVRDAVILAHWKAQSYKSEQYVDLWDLCNVLQESCDADAVRNACESLKKTISSPTRGIVMKAIYSGPAYQHSHGLSIYFPWSEVSANYKASGFARATEWHRFLEEYAAITRREMRGERKLCRSGFRRDSDQRERNAVSQVDCARSERHRRLG